jgi:hypothetical protein
VSAAAPSTTGIIDDDVVIPWCAATGAIQIQSNAADLLTETTGAAILTSTNFAAAFGTAGSADSQVMSVQGVASMTPLLSRPVGFATGGGAAIVAVSDNSDNEDEHAVCTADCTIYSVTAFNHAATTAFLRCEMDTAGNTTPGSETASSNEPNLEIPGATTGAGVTINFGAIGVAYTTALTCWVVTEEAATGTTDVGENDVRVMWVRAQ